MRLTITVIDWVEVPTRHRLYEHHRPWRELELVWSADTPEAFALHIGNVRERLGYAQCRSTAVTWRDLPITLLNDLGALVRHVRYLPCSTVEEPHRALDCLWALADGLRPLIAQARGSTRPDPA